MTKQWKCKDCVKQNTDACYFQEVVDGYKYCHDIVVDTDFAYEQGRAEVIDEVCEFVFDYIDAYWFKSEDEFKEYVKEQLKEVKECTTEN